MDRSGIEIVLDVQQTDEFSDWLAGLRDIRARARILTRVARFALGNLGDVKSVGDGVSEARIDYGPGYRIYFVRRGEVVLLLLCGGSKHRQQVDIERAKELAEIYGDEDSPKV